MPGEGVQSSDLIERKLLISSRRMRAILLPRSDVILLPNIRPFLADVSLTITWISHILLARRAKRRPNLTKRFHMSHSRFSKFWSS